MVDNDRVSKVSLAIFDKNPYYWAVGCEISKNGQTYFIYSLSINRKEIPSKRRLIYYMISEVMKEVPDDDELVVFYSSIPHFDKPVELERKSARFANGKKLIFAKVDQVLRSTIWLALDAAQREGGESITERL